MGDCLGGVPGRSPAKSLGSPGQILGTFLGDCLGGVPGGSLAKSLGGPCQTLGGILGQLSRGVLGEVVQIDTGIAGNTMGKTSASFEKSSGVLTKSWGQFWATARGSSWKSHANCLGHFGHFLGHSLGEIRKICGREPGPFLGAIFDDCPEEFLGKFWEVMGRS